MRYTLKEIASLIEGIVEGDTEATVSAFGKIEDAKEGELSFIANAKYESYLYTSQATAVLVSKDFEPAQPYKPSLIRVENPYASLAKLMQFVAEELNPKKEGIAQEAFIHPSVKIPKRCYIAPFVHIEEGVVLGEGCSIYLIVTSEKMLRLERIPLSILTFRFTILVQLVRIALFTLEQSLVLMDSVLLLPRQAMTKYLNWEVLKSRIM